MPWGELTRAFNLIPTLRHIEEPKTADKFAGYWTGQGRPRRGHLRRRMSLPDNNQGDAVSLTAREMNWKARVFWTKQATLRKQNPDLFQVALEHMHLECHSACNIDPLSRGIGVQN
jgi:hypothetical protein